MDNSNIVVDKYTHLCPYGWGCEYPYNVQEIISLIMKEFRRLISDRYYPKTICLISNWDGDPETGALDDINAHWIRLNTDDLYWAQIIYQFSHEYCHHLIGKLSGELDGIHWFEESLCHMASLYMLKRMKDVFYLSANNNFKYYAPSLYLYYTKTVNQISKIDPCLKDWIHDNIAYLRAPMYRRDMYDTIAMNILAIFENNKSLWNFLPFIGKVNFTGNEREYFDNLIFAAPKDRRPVFEHLIEHIY